MVSVDHKLASRTADFATGALVVGLNAGHISAALVNASGNPIEIYNLPCVAYGKSPNRLRTPSVPVIAELLDFSEQKKMLKNKRDARYACMLSSFACSALAER